MVHMFNLVIKIDINVFDILIDGPSRLQNRR